MRSVSCSSPLGMKPLIYPMGLSLSVCIALVACSMPQKQKFDLYELQPQNARRVDYDAYYTPPKTSSLCANSIGEAPSCGGI